MFQLSKWNSSFKRREEKRRGEEERRGEKRRDVCVSATDYTNTKPLFSAQLWWGNSLESIVYGEQHGRRHGNSLHKFILESHLQAGWQSAGGWQYSGEMQLHVSLIHIPLPGVWFQPSSEIGCWPRQNNNLSGLFNVFMRGTYYCYRDCEY